MLKKRMSMGKQRLWVTRGKGMKVQKRTELTRQKPCQMIRGITMIAYVNRTITGTPPSLTCGRSLLIGDFTGINVEFLHAICAGPPRRGAVEHAVAHVSVIHRYMCLLAYCRYSSRIVE